MGGFRWTGAGLVVVFAACSSANPSFDDPIEGLPSTSAATTSTADLATDAGDDGADAGSGATTGDPTEECAPDPGAQPLTIRVAPTAGGNEVFGPCGQTYTTAALLTREGDAFLLHLYCQAGECQACDTVPLQFSSAAPNVPAGDTRCVNLEVETRPVADGCEIAYLDLWEDGQPSLYVGGHVIRPNNSPVEVSAELQTECPCEPAAGQCCEPYAPGAYHLTFSTGTDAVSLEPTGAPHTLAGGAKSYEVRNGESYVLPRCDARQEFSYVIRRLD